MEFNLAHEFGMCEGLLCLITFPLEDSDPRLGNVLEKYCRQTTKDWRGPTNLDIGRGKRLERFTDNLQTLAR